MWKNYDEAMTEELATKYTTLYELETYLTELFTQLQEAEDEPTPELQEQVTVYFQDAVAKRDRCGQFLLHLESVETSIDNEIDRLKKRKVSIKNARERFEGYILAVMERIGVKRLDGATYSFLAKKNPPAIEITNVTDLPPIYFRQKPPPPPEPDKRAISDALKIGEDVPGARLIQSTRLEVK